MNQGTYEVTGDNIQTYEPVCFSWCDGSRVPSLDLRCRGFGLQSGNMKVQINTRHDGDDNDNNDYDEEEEHNDRMKMNDEDE